MLVIVFSPRTAAKANQKCQDGDNDMQKLRAFLEVWVLGASCVVGVREWIWECVPAMTDDER